MLKKYRYIGNVVNALTFGTGVNITFFPNKIYKLPDNSVIQNMLKKKYLEYIEDCPINIRNYPKVAPVITNEEVN